MNLLHTHEKNVDQTFMNNLNIVLLKDTILIRYNDYSGERNS